MGLSLARALRLQTSGQAGKVRLQGGNVPRAPTIAFVGAGGKTTAIFQLAHELPPPVLLTTTTHLGEWQAPLANQHIIATRPEDLSDFTPGSVSLITGPKVSEGRLASVTREVLLWLHDMAQQQRIPLLIEADGSRQKLLKAPAGHEPDIPSFADLLLVVAGLSALGKPLTEEWVHRPERYSAVSRLNLGDSITPEAMVRVLMNDEGGLKGIPPRARRVVLLNQADSAALQAQARTMASQLLSAFDAVLVASLKASEVHAVHERAAGVVLAAGASTRLGRPKQLLDWHGQPFVRAVAQTALTAGLDPVVVVTGSGRADVEAALRGMSVTLAKNPEWQSGQASSIRVGLQELPPATGSAVFLLADQPQVTFAVVRALSDTHAVSLSPIVAPLVQMERRANPVLFDRDTFPDLMALQGDVGGRAVFSKYRVEYMPWHDDRLLLDVDTEADYQRLMEDDTL